METDFKFSVILVDILEVSFNTLSIWFVIKHSFSSSYM